VGVDTDHNLWDLPMFSSTGWQSLNLAGIRMVSVQRQGVVFALSSSTTGCTSPNSPLLILNSSGTGWNSMGKCFNYITGGDGILVGITSASAMSYSANPNASSPTWTSVAGTWESTTAAVYNSSIVYAVRYNALGPLQVYALNLQTGAQTLYSDEEQSVFRSIAASVNGYLFVLTSGGLAA